LPVPRARFLRPLLSLTDIVMVYVLSTAMARLIGGRGNSAVTAFATVVRFNFCFVPPRLGLAVADRHYLFTFAARLTIARVIAQLVATARARARARKVSVVARHTPTDTRSSLHAQAHQHAQGHTHFAQRR
jgi:K+-sensing histidine kinase KdpD